MNSIEERKKKVKELIEKLINQGDIEYAKKYVEEYANLVKDDVDVYSFKGIINFIEGNYDEAERNFKTGLLKDYNNFDLLYNLAKLKEKQEKKDEALSYYLLANKYCSDDALKNEISETIKALNENGTKADIPVKIAFFVKPRMDNFLDDIIMGLTGDYETRKILVNGYEQINEGMAWADICWFEWCDELVIYGSKHPLAKEKKIICRLHSYEAFTDYPVNVHWQSVDKIIFVGEHIKEIVNNKVGIADRSVIINNGIDLEKFNFKERDKGFNVAYVGYINYKKGPMLLLQVINSLVKKDKRYKLHIAGRFQDERYVLYFNQMLNELNLQNSVIFHGWIEDINEWLEDKNYIISTSVLESQHCSIMEAMAKGIKPIIHNFVGAKRIFNEKYIWNTVDDAVDMIVSKEYDSREYRKFIEDNYSLEKQIKNIKGVITELNNSIMDVQDDNLIVHKKTLWDAIWGNYNLQNPIDIVNEPGGMVLRSEFVELLNRFFILKGLKILEVGCGSGLFSIELCSRNAVYTGIDISENSIELATNIQHFYGIKSCDFKLGNAFNMEYPIHSYDITFNVGVVEHFNDEQIITVLKKMARVGKYVIVGVPYSGSNLYGISKKYSQSKGKWEYGFERDFYTLKPLFEKAGIKLLYEDIIGYQSECQYVKRINPEVYEIALGQNISRVFSSINNKVGNWLISIGTAENIYENLFLKVINENLRLENKDEFLSPKNEDSPSVSVIVPFLNTKNYAKKAVENLSKINYNNLQIVFVNDGSTDDTEKILKNELSKIVGADFLFINMQENKGQFIARLEGIKHSSGKYVFFHNIDDLIYHDSITRLLKDRINFSDNVHLPVSCALMENYSFLGQIWYHRFLPGPMDYLIDEINDLCGKVSIINTLFKREYILPVYNNLVEFLSKSLIDQKIRVGEDTLLSDYMILEQAIDSIIPVFYTLQGYQFDNNQSMSKKLNERIKAVPIQMAFTVSYLLNRKIVDKDIEKNIKKAAYAIYGENAGKIFMDNYEKHRKGFDNLLFMR